MLDSFRATVALTAVLAVVFLAAEWSVTGWPDSGLALFVVLAAANTLPLLAIRHNPVAVVAVFSVAYPLWIAAGFGAATLQSLPTAAAMYAAGAWRRPLALRALALLSPAWMLAAVVAQVWPVPVVELGYVAIVLVVIWALGVTVASRQAYAEQLEVRTAELERAQHALADRAVADERARIARELHDVVAHAMSLITVQAGVGAHLVDTTPAKAADALRIIEHTGRQAMSEMRRMLTVLRAPGATSDRGDPQPGLGSLPDLIAATRAGGVAVQLTVEGTPRALPPGLDLAAYRIVQEALTNVRRHAPGTTARVTVGHRADAVTIEVRNPVQQPVDVRPGQGLRGMAERAALYDGTFGAGAHDGEFVVIAHLPATEPP